MTPPTEPSHILIVEDDFASRSLLVSYFENEGYRVSETDHGESLVQKVLDERIDLVLLDINLPGKDGLTLTRELRAHSKVGIILVTSKGDEIDRIVGLELGADDYVTKPFSPRELVARIRTILKRSQKAQASTSLTHGELSLDPRAHRCQINGQEIALTAREQGILALLLQDPARIRSRAELISQIWGAGSQVSDRTLDSHLRNLRAKLEQAGGNDLIETVHAVGIRLRGLS